MKKLLLLLFSAGLCVGAEAKLETGELNGAQFRIDVPAVWNGSLIVYCHGYSVTPGKFDQAEAKPVLAAMLAQGYAVAQSGYAAGGWAIQEATQDTEALRRYFIHKYGVPKQTFLSGHSMGGFLTMMMMETQSPAYDGGLAFCGPLAPAPTFVSPDPLVVFGYYFPGALPNPVAVPADYNPSSELTQKITDLLQSKPEATAVLLHYFTMKSEKDLAGTLVFLTYVMGEVARRARGNPFDNRNTIYAVTGSDNDLNEHVQRYEADPKAYAYLRNYYTPTGRLVKPMLAIHTSYDPLVPTAIPGFYSRLTREVGTSELFVQQFVEHDGHCAITPEETAQGLVELQDWVNQGKRPMPGWLKVAAGN